MRVGKDGLKIMNMDLTLKRICTDEAGSEAGGAVAGAERGVVSGTDCGLQKRSKRIS